MCELFDFTVISQNCTRTIEHEEGQPKIKKEETALTSTLQRLSTAAQIAKESMQMFIGLMKPWRKKS